MFNVLFNCTANFNMTNPTKSKVQDELCSMSVYSSWREKQLQRWQEPDVSGSVLIGLVVGLSSAGAFLLWQGIQLKQIPDSFRGRVQCLC